MLKRFLTYGLILMLLIFMTACGGSSSDSSDASNSDSSSESESKTETSEDYTVGSTFTADGVSVSLNSVTTSMGNDFSQPEAGYIYLMLDWTIANDGEEELNPFNVSMNAFCDGTATEGAITGLDGQLNTTSMLPPGTNTTGYRIYEVPESWSEFMVRVQIGMVDGETATFTIAPDQVS